MKTLYYTAASQDGFIAVPDHLLDCLLQFEMTEDYPDFIGDVGVIALSSTSSEWELNKLSWSGVEIQKAWLC